MHAPFASPCAGAAHVVADEAAGHARELIARRELELVDLAVALGALDVPREVLLVGEAQVRRGEHHRRDLAVLAGVVPTWQNAHCPFASSPALTFFEIRVIDVVAVVAGLRGLGQQAIVGDSLVYAAAWQTLQSA